MTLQGKPQNHSESTPLPVLQIPLDNARQKRKDTFALYRLDLGAKITMHIAALSNAIERQSLLLATYLGWIYRMSGEKEVATAAYNSAGIIPVMVSIDDYSNFQDLVQAVANQLETNQTSSTIQSETIFSFGVATTPQPDHLINWTIEENHSSLSLIIDYNDSLLNATTIETFAFYYIRLLEGLIDQPQFKVGSIDILNRNDVSLYNDLNNTYRTYAENQTFHGAFEAAVSQYGERIAIASPNTEYTYNELNVLSNKVAHQLLAKGLQKGEFVVMFMDRSLDTVISLLGIMKAGGVYVPIDPEHPDERNAYIIEDTRAAYILTKDEYHAKAKELTASISTVRGIYAVTDITLIADSSYRSNPNIQVSSDDLAYIIYTSGSTGKPKGALIAHRGVVNLGEVVRKDCDITAEDVLTQFATYSFDASVWDTIGALFYGAKLYLLDADERVSVEEFAEAIERTGTTIITILPTVFFNQLSAYLSDEGYQRLSKVKLITVAGEALYGEQVRAFQRKFGDQIDIVNVYGPTECTVCTTTHKISGIISEDVVNIPIGRPIYNYKVYIVNDEQMLCPVGVPGEVYISTVGLAQGYLNQPQKTAEAFITSPIEEGELIYRSGDLAKLLADGTIEYVGRRDSQIKIRGHRIEIGEIEDNLNRFEGVQDAVVVAKKDHADQNMLVAYFTSKDTTILSPSMIKQFLSDRLPSYFVPKFVCQLEMMPISPTGKIDRKKLIGYDHIEAVETATDYVAPQNEQQQIIAEAWQQVLDKPTISIHEDFFDIGGDSLQVIQILTILKPHFPLVKISDFFMYRTIVDLANRILELEQLNAQDNLFNLPIALTDLPEYPPIAEAAKSANTLESSHILLTGATGYLGSHILYELLHQSDAYIYTLVRKKGDAPAIERVKATMNSYFGSDMIDRVEQRVIAIEGDLELAQLGISAEDHKLLVERIDTIIHSAADVRHFGEATQFAKTNIQSTADLLELAHARPGIRFHHVSTMGIPEDLSLEGKWNAVLESGSLPENIQADSVYTNSKLEAEKLIYAAGSKGIPVNIYRAGNLSSHSVTGQFQRNIDSNAVYRMIKAMILLGQAPEADQWMDFTPIDYASRAIVHLALRKDTVGQLFHISNPQQIQYTHLLALINNYGYAVQAMPFNEYSSWLLDNKISKSIEAVQLAMAQLEGDGAKNSPFRYSNPETTRLLEQGGVYCPAPDQEFVSAMLGYAASIDYLPTVLTNPSSTALEA